MTNRRLLTGFVLGFLSFPLVLGGLASRLAGAQDPTVVEVGAESTQIGPICVDEHRPLLQIDDLVIVNVNRTCATIFIGENPPIDTQCDDVTCSQVKLDDEAPNVGNVLDTQPTAGPNSSLYWGGGKVWTSANHGAGSTLDADRVDGLDSTQLLVPSGAVMAFDLAACPAGWTAFLPAAGRNVVGVGAGAGLTPRTLGQTGGEESHAMSVSEMPSHAHGIQFNRHFAADGGNGDFGPGGGASYGTDATGGSQPFNVMDPYVALLYCKKT